LCTNVREFAQSRCLRHGAVMQRIIPRKICSRKPDLPEGAGDRFAIGDMQHQEEANTAPVESFYRTTLELTFWEVQWLFAARQLNGTCKAFFMVAVPDLFAGGALNVLFPASAVGKQYAGEHQCDAASVFSLQIVVP